MISYSFDAAQLDVDHQIVETSNMLVKQRHVPANLKDYILVQNTYLQRRSNQFLFICKL